MMSLLSFLGGNHADWGYELWPDPQTEKVSIVEGMGIYYPLINISMFDSIIEYVVRDNTLLSSRALSSRQTTGKSTIMLNVEVKLHILREVSTSFGEHKAQ